VNSSLAQLEVPVAASEEGLLTHWVLRELERLRECKVAILGVPVPLLPLDRFLALAGDEDAWLWDPPGEGGFAAIGTLCEVRASGATRFEDVQRRAEALFAGIGSAHRSRPEGSLARLFGGFSCFSNLAADPLWDAWGEARFVLPRIFYEIHDDGTATLGIACDLERPLSRQELAREVALTLTSYLRRLTTEHPTEPALPVSVSVLERKELGQAEWRTLVGQIRASIEAENLEKIVAARRSSLRLKPDPEWRQVLLRLAADNAACTRFALKYGNSAFLGATPERLVRKLDTQFDTEALAGSARSGPEGALALLESAKDLEEHAIVVREILRALEPFAESLTAPKAPHVHALQYVSHLRTPISGVLAAPTHILELVAALHPTPAVGGVPKERAQRFIEAHERDRRGWYAGPIGWFDSQGDGSFAVALRSALLKGDQAHLYAGAGIVRGSEPDAEYQETELKFQGLLRALGVSG